MNRAIIAILWKEYRQIAARKRAVIINAVCMYMFTIVIAITRLLSLRANGEDSLNMITCVVIYVSVTGVYMALLSMLRFWQEKSNRTIETLLCLPTSVFYIVLAKTIVPVLISAFIGIFNSVITLSIISVLYGKIMILIPGLLLPVFFAIAIGIPYSVINAYSMWCMNLTYSKLMQGISSFAYVALLAILFTNLNTEWFAILRIILFGAAFLWSITLFLAFRFNTERIILKLLD